MHSGQWRGHYWHESRREVLATSSSPYRMAYIPRSHDSYPLGQMLLDPGNDVLLSNSPPPITVNWQALAGISILVPRVLAPFYELTRIQAADITETMRCRYGRKG